MKTITADNRLDLGPSGWNYWRLFYTGRAWRAGSIPVPIFIAGVVARSPWLIAGGVVLSGIAQLLAIRGQRDAYATRSVIHCRRGILGLSAQDIPISDVDDVFVELVSVAPGVGDLTIKCRNRSLTFEGVRDAEEVRQRLLFRRDRARVVQRLTRGADRDRRTRSKRM